MSAEDQKRRTGEAAAALAEDGMTVGLGTGSTAAWFVRALAARKLDIRCVSTSEATEKLAVELGLRTLGLDEAKRIDLTVDGADEIGPGLNLIKGAGAALLREKLVWEASDRCVCIADGSKRTDYLGAVFPLPIEIVAFGAESTALRLSQRLAHHGFGGELKRRPNVITDSGNPIYDLFGVRMEPPEPWAALIKETTGVVDHGLFLGLCDLAIVATETDIVHLDRNA